MQSVGCGPSRTCNHAYACVWHAKKLGWSASYICVRICMWPCVYVYAAYVCVRECAHMCTDLQRNDVNTCWEWRIVKLRVPPEALYLPFKHVAGTPLSAGSLHIHCRYL